MKNKLFTLLLAVAASVGTMFAQQVQIGGLYYDLDATSQTAEVARYNSVSGEIIIPSSVTYNSVSYSVTSIGNYAFRGCTGLTSVTIPNSVTSIGYAAFQGCSGLTSIEIPNSVTSIGSSAFSVCTGLTSVTIPNSVTSIGNSAFAACRGLTSVTIPNSVTSIGNEAFSGCSSLTSVIVENGNSFYDSRNNCNAIIETATNTLIVGCMNTIIPNSVTSIGGGAFWGCSGLTSVTIPNSVTSIGDQAFEHCISLTSVTIPNSVTSIGYAAFQGCSGLTSIEIPNSVTSIGERAFSYCTGLTSVIIGNSVTSIGNNAFYECSSLTSVIIGNNVTSIGKDAFYNCRSLISVKIPNSVTSIGERAFYGCIRLTSVIIGNSVTSIGDDAFYECRSLTSVTIGNSVTSIGLNAFYNCSGLTSPVYNAHVFAFMPTSYSGAYTIPDGIESIAGGAFSGCTGLTSVTIPNSVTSIGKEAFYGCKSLTAIYVPCGEMERFKQMLNKDSRIKDHAPLPYTITINAEHGNVTYPQTMCDDMSLNATPDYGYHFVQWSDGVTDNPRTIELTRDTTFTAEFAIDKTGNCGDDNALIWTYDAETKTLTITGNGTLNSNYYFGIEAPAQMQKLVLGNEVTSIGDSAFYGMSTINHLIIGGSVATIGNYAFAECRNFDDITCYATTVPIINETTFANVGNKQYIYLFVPEARERAYHRDTYWGEFDIQVQQAEEATVTTTDVTVEPQDNAVTLVWPTNDNAASYTIEITKDGVLFCTLTFNANGQLTGIAFAPSRDGHAHAPAAVMTANGLQFTVTGLDSNTQYGYSVVTKDASDQPIASYSGTFKTTGAAMGIENQYNTVIEHRKVMINGQIFILRGEKVYILTGAEVIVP